MRNVQQVLKKNRIRSGSWGGGIWLCISYGNRRRCSILSQTAIFKQLQSNYIEVVDKGELELRETQVRTEGARAGFESYYYARRGTRTLGDVAARTRGGGAPWGEESPVKTNIALFLQ